MEESSNHHRHRGIIKTSNFWLPWVSLIGKKDVTMYKDNRGARGSIGGYNEASTIMNDLFIKRESDILNFMGKCLVDDSPGMSV